MSRFAFLAGGRLHISNDSKVSELKSQFAQAIRDRALAMQQRHAWKSEGTGAQFMGAWAKPRTMDPAEMPIEISAVAHADTPGSLLYVVETPDICGLLRVENLGLEETRLWHSNDTRIRDLSRHPAEPRLACAVTYPAGTANIGVLRADGGGLKEITEGDSVDMAPSWVPGKTEELVFQSAGLGRGRDGIVRSLGPFHIQHLDLERGEIETIADDARFDFLNPRCDAQGGLYYIRRPYRTDTQPLWRLALDVLLIPFRLLWAVFQFFNFFTNIFTGKPLTSAGASSQRSLDAKRLVLWGNVIEAEKEMRKRNAGDAPDLVPKTWELVRRASDRAETVIAKGVLSYDLLPDGGVLYSNGSAVFLRQPDGKTERLLRHEFIVQVIALG